MACYYKTMESLLEALNNKVNKKRYNEKSMAEKSATGIAIITAVFICIVAFDAIRCWADSDSYAKTVYGIVLSVSITVEIVMLLSLKKTKKEN